MSLKGIDDYHSLSEQIKLTKLPDENQKSARAVADIIGDAPDVRLLKAETETWRTRFIAACVAIILVAGGLGFACYTFYTSDDDLASEWEAGYAQGKSDGYTVGYDEGFAAGASQSFAIQQESVQVEEPAVVEPEPEPDVSTESSGQAEITVYVTDTGTKYHRGGCGSLWNSSHEKTLSQAIAQGYGPCGNCNPPIG